MAEQMRSRHFSPVRCDELSTKPSGLMFTANSSVLWLNCGEPDSEAHGLIGWSVLQTLIADVCQVTSNWRNPDMRE